MKPGHEHSTDTEIDRLVRNRLNPFKQVDWYTVGSIAAAVAVGFFASSGVQVQQILPKPTKQVRVEQIDSTLGIINNQIDGLVTMRPEFRIPYTEATGFNVRKAEEYSLRLQSERTDLVTNAQVLAYNRSIEQNQTQIERKEIIGTMSGFATFFTLIGGGIAYNIFKRRKERRNTQ